MSGCWQLFVEMSVFTVWFHPVSNLAITQTIWVVALTVSWETPGFLSRTKLPPHKKTFPSFYSLLSLLSKGLLCIAVAIWIVQHLLGIFHFLETFTFGLIAHSLILFLRWICSSKHHKRQEKTDETTKYKEYLESQESVNQKNI